MYAGYTNNIKMESVWFRSELAEEIIKNNGLYDDIQSIVSDIMSDKIDILHLVENMAGVLTNKEAENREKGMRFFTRLLKELPKDYLTEKQVKFISKFYIDRLKDNHRIIPTVLEGYLTIIDMKNYYVPNCAEFFTTLFREVPCQSQVRQDRYHIYLLIQKLVEKDLECMKLMGPDFVYGFISSMDSERDPRNLLFLFSFLPKFLSNIPLGHLVDEMFEVLSCYYPIDFHPSEDDPAAISRNDLAMALTPCLCAIPEFGEQCLILLIEKLDSSLRLAKVDSLKLLKESCKVFKAETYGPFLKALGSSINREISHKSDEELKMAAHEALFALVAKLATTASTDQAFENFVKGFLISMQTSIAESTTVAQFTQATKVLLTVANASRESCIIIAGSMIPATVAFYGFKTSPKLQIASLNFLADLYNVAHHWEIIDCIKKQINEIPQLCLTAVSDPDKEYQIAGFKTLINVKNALKDDLVLPFIEVLIHNIQHSQDNVLLSVCVETIHVIARKYPELIMNIVVKGKCDVENLTEDKTGLNKRLHLLSNLASIDEFTKIIIEEMLKIITNNGQDACKVIGALSESISDSSLYSNHKVTQIESDHGLIDSVITWLMREIEVDNPDLSHGYTLISLTMSNLPNDKQEKILEKYTTNILDKCKTKDSYFLIIASLYGSISQDVYYSNKMEEIMKLSLRLSVKSVDEEICNKACILAAHFLNKAEYGQKFEMLYELLKNYLSTCKKDDHELSPRLIRLYGWIAKALVLRGSDMFLFWLQKIMESITNPDYCKLASESIQLIMTDYPDFLNKRHHCTVSILYKQRVFQTFANLAEKITDLDKDTKEAYLLSWAYILGKAPRNVLNTQVDKIARLVIDSLDYDNRDLLLVMIDVLCYLVESKHISIAASLQSILPRLVNLTTYVKSMDVRIKTLQCLYDIANSYSTALLLPYKQDILLDLAPSLDDKKRLVRNIAVRARTRWFLIGAPGEPKEN